MLSSTLHILTSSHRLDTQHPNAATTNKAVTGIDTFQYLRPITASIGSHREAWTFTSRTRDVARG